MNKLFWVDTSREEEYGYYVVAENLEEALVMAEMGSYETEYGEERTDEKSLGKVDINKKGVIYDVENNLGLYSGLTGHCSVCEIWEDGMTNLINGEFVCDDCYAGRHVCKIVSLDNKGCYLLFRNEKGQHMSTFFSSPMASIDHAGKEYLELRFRERLTDEEYEFIMEVYEDQVYDLVKKNEKN